MILNRSSTPHAAAKTLNSVGADFPLGTGQAMAFDYLAANNGRCTEGTVSKEALR